MSSKLERQLNFIQVLLAQRSPVTKEFLRQHVGGYKPSDGDPRAERAFEKMFDRDKLDLLEQGVPLETRKTDALSDVVDGYVIDKEKFFLPRIQLTEIQQQLLQQASRAWFDDTLRKSAIRATHHVVSDDIDGAISDLDARVTLALNPRGVNSILEAISNEQAVSFDYVSSSSPDIVHREIDPWQLFVFGGHWYVIGRDLAKSDGYRIFKLSRIKGDIKVLNQKIQFHQPDDFAIADVIQEWTLSTGGSQSAQLLVSAHEAGILRRNAVTIQGNADGDILEIPYGSEFVLAQLIAEVADHVTVLAPESLALAVHRILTAGSEVHSDES